MRPRLVPIAVLIYAGCSPFGSIENAPDAAGTSGSNDADANVDSASNKIDDAGVRTHKEASVDDAAHVPTCVGQPFGAPKQVNTSAIAASVTSFVLGMAVVEGNAYFGAVPKTPDFSYSQVFRASFTGGDSPSVSNAVRVMTHTATAAPHYWSPAVASDASFVVHQMKDPPRDLALSLWLGGGGVRGGGTVGWPQHHV